LAKRDEIKRTGVYFIVGQDPEFPSREKVYIGEGDSVLKRLTDHDRDETRDFWTKTLVVISKDENLTKSHGRYLESRLIAMTGEAGRATLANGTAPPLPPLPEPDVADMEAFLDYLQMMLPVLGFSFLQPRPLTESLPGKPMSALDSPTFVMEDVGTSARAKEVNGEFVVLRGSTARKEGVDSWMSYRGLREQLVAEGKLVPDGRPEFLVFADDVAFSSPSAAASVVAARNTNGRRHWWIKETSPTYAEWQEAKLKRASEGAAQTNALPATP